MLCMDKAYRKSEREEAVGMKITQREVDGQRLHAIQYPVACFFSSVFISRLIIYNIVLDH
jgi:hypothetical protein